MRLTERQTELIEILADGESQESAAKRLGISIQTVKNHLYDMRKNAGAPTTTALVVMWLRGAGTTADLPPAVTLGEWERLVDRVSALEALHIGHRHD